MTQYANIFSGRQFLDSSGAPYSGAKLFTYYSGSSTKITCTKDQPGTSNHANPIVLNTKGEPADAGGAAQAIWQPGGQAVKLVLAPSTDTDPPVSPIATWDNLAGVNDASVTVDQWVSGPTPTYVGATQYTLAGDQTSTFHVGRRVKTTNSGGTIYGTITVSAYTTLTTITVVNDSGALDSGLSAVSYGLLSATNPSVPGVKMSGADWTHTGLVTMSGKSIVEANASIAAHATTMDPWSLGNYVTLTGVAVTFTNIATAPQAGAEVEIYMNAAHVFTDGAVFEVDGDANWTAEAGDRVLLRAKSTTVFTVHPRRKNGSSIVGLHEVYLIDGNGAGSTNTKIRRFVTTVVNTGSAITYADSVADGASFTINAEGVYNILYSDYSSTTAVVHGISLNSAQLTTAIDSITNANRLSIANSAINTATLCSVTKRLSAGDVIRPHLGVGTSATGVVVFFAIRKVG
jgi:hypothetical protein